MAKFYGKVGFGETVETSPGVHEDVIVEHIHFGDVLRAARSLVQGESLNQDISVANTLSIVSNAYSNEHIFDIRYVEWAGVLWTVSSVEVQSPRLLLHLGEVYNGPTPDPTP